MIKLKKYSKESLMGSLFFLSFFISSAQEITWRNPLSEQVVLGRSKELKESDGYNRLPAALKQDVREPVWYLGQQDAGVYVEFSTPAENIYVRYTVKDKLEMGHMPATGVSGLDLYAQDPKDKSWKWAHGKFSFKDTITYNFLNIGSHPDYQYRLYLPLYNHVKWMEIGTKTGEAISFKSNEKKPIVVYGTSIAQGACATRPGLGWTNMLGRNFDQPVINLAFSGNGRLEQPILDLINRMDPAVYILDCIPNLALKGARTADTLTNLIENAVRTLRKDHPNTPIIMTAHSSSQLKDVLNQHTNEEFAASSAVAEKTIKSLIKKGDKNLYWVSSQDIGMDINSTVDYTHPNDIGMQKLADVYTKLLKKVIK